MTKYLFHKVNIAGQQYFLSFFFFFNFLSYIRKIKIKTHIHTHCKTRALHLLLINFLFLLVAYMMNLSCPSAARLEVSKVSLKTDCLEE